MNSIKCLEDYINYYLHTFSFYAVCENTDDSILYILSKLMGHATDAPRVKVTSPVFRLPNRTVYLYCY